MLINKQLDDIDKKLIEMLQKDPSITHSSIANELNRSQPAIGARIKKLTDSGILSTQIGVDFKKLSSLNLCKIEIITSNPEEVLNMADFCPYVINAFKLSGEYNVAVLMASSNLKRLDLIIDRHFRNQDYISKVRMDLITSFGQPFILPIDFNIENFEKFDDFCEGCEYAEKMRKEYKVK